MAEELVLEGKTTVDDKMVFEPQRLSYEASRAIAEKIARRISERTKDRLVVIAGMQLLADFGNVVAIRSMLEEIAGEYDGLTKAVQASTYLVPHAPVTTRSRSDYAQLAVPSFDTLSAGVKSALSLLSLFRQDVDYRGVPLSIDTLAFEVELAARLRMHKARHVLVPDFTMFTTSDTGASALRTLFERVKAARNASIQVIAAKAPKRVRGAGTLNLREALAAKRAEREVIDLEHVDLERGDQAHADQQHEQSTEAPAPNFDAIVEIFGEIDRRFGDLESQLAKSETDAGGRTLSSRLHRAEKILAQSPLLVHTRVLLAGGSNRIARSFFRSMFTGDGLSFTGGAVVSWAVLSEHGAIEDGGVITESMSAASAKPPRTPLEHR